MAASTTERALRAAAAVGALSALGVAGASLATSSGCQPDLGAPASQVTSLRLLAISGTPAEAAPGTMVTYSALLVDGTGERPDLLASMDWAFCNLQKPLSDLGDIYEKCFTLDVQDYDGGTFVELSKGTTTTGALPLTGCSLFGPDTPPAPPGMPAGRPADPDPSGGYYQPMRVILVCQGAGAACAADGDCCSGHCQAAQCAGGSAQTVLGAEESRITCGLPGATPMTLTTFHAEYRPNTNPTVTSVAAVDPQTGSPLAAVSAGQRVTLRATWPSCAPGMTSCGGAEAYALYDEPSQTVTRRCETMTVSWFANAGSFAADRSSPDAGAGAGIVLLDGGLDGGAPAACNAPTFADNLWTAPTTPGTALVWTVLRDDRGGVAWQRYAIDVTR